MLAKTLQFELWQECNNHCDYCYLGSENRKTPDALKLASIKRALSAISNPKLLTQGYDCIGYIGGEFFQGQLRNAEVKEAFFKLMQKTASLYNSQAIKQVWLSATLNIGNQEDLWATLDLFDNHKDVWIITSWDTIGRFKSEKMLNTWDYSMKELKRRYPDIKINITTILTGDLIDKYLADEISFQKMMQIYDASFFFKHCGSIVKWKTTGNYEESRIAKQKSNEILPNFFPTRRQFLQFLVKFKEQESEDMWNRLFNIKLRADNFVRNFNDGSVMNSIRLKDSKTEVNEMNHLPCGHPFVYAAYLDSDKCVLCDKQNMS